MLAGLPFLDDPRVLVGAPAGDDAGVYRLDDDVALVQTVDVFSPSADDPYLFGQIAAANSLSDVYAMGGRPITALSIVGFPLHAAARRRPAPDSSRRHRQDGRGGRGRHRRTQHQRPARSRPASPSPDWCIPSGS